MPIFPQENAKIPPPKGFRMYFPGGFEARNRAKTGTERVTQQIPLYRWKVPKRCSLGSPAGWGFWQCRLARTLGNRHEVFLPIAVINRLT